MAAAQRATKSWQQETRAVPRRDKTRPARVARPHFRYKTRSARAKWPLFEVFCACRAHFLPLSSAKTTQGEFPFAPSPHQEHPHRAGQFFLQPVHDRRVHTSNHHRRWESAQRPTPTGTLQRRNTTQPRAPSTQINQDLHSEMITPTYMASSFSH